MTVEDICKGFVYNEVEGKGLFGWGGRLVIQPEYQRNYMDADHGNIVLYVSETGSIAARASSRLRAARSYSADDDAVERKLDPPERTRHQALRSCPKITFTHPKALRD